MAKPTTTVALTNEDLYWIMEWSGQAVPSGEDEMSHEEAKTYRKLLRAQSRVYRKNKD